jgi:hypothetical protein
MLERDIEKAVCRYARKEHNVYVRKFTSPAHRSVPDDIFLFPNGQILFIEFKATGKKMTGAQIREAQRIRNVGRSVVCIDDIGLGKALVDSVASTPVSTRSD